MDVESGEVRGACCAGLDPERNAGVAEGDVAAAKEATDGRRSVFYAHWGKKVRSGSWS